MGYFANSSAGMAYEEQYCDNCYHEGDEEETWGCTVWLLHHLHNYEECNKKDSFLHSLIPRDANGVNGPCSMFLDKDQVVCTTSGSTQASQEGSRSSGKKKKKKRSRQSSRKKKKEQPTLPPLTKWVKR